MLNLTAFNVNYISNVIQVPNNGKCHSIIEESIVPDTAIMTPTTTEQHEGSDASIIPMVERETPIENLFPEWHAAFNSLGDEDAGLDFENFIKTAHGYAEVVVDSLFRHSGLPFKVKMDRRSKNPHKVLFDATHEAVDSYFTSLKLGRPSPLRNVHTDVEAALKAFMDHERINEDWCNLLPRHEEVLALRICHPEFLFESTLATALATMNKAYLMQASLPLAPKNPEPQPTPIGAEATRLGQEIESRFKLTEMRIYELKVEHGAVRTDLAEQVDTVSGKVDTCVSDVEKLRQEFEAFKRLSLSSQKSQASSASTIWSPYQARHRKEN